MSLLIRRARLGEAGLVLSFVRELAEYEKLLHEMEATEADIDTALFGAHPRLFCEIAEWDGEPAGFAVWFANFSTFSGSSGIYLEDRRRARRPGRLRGLDRQFLDLQRSLRNLSGRSVPSSGAARKGHRQSAAGGPRTAMRG